MDDKFILGGMELMSRVSLGSGKYHLIHRKVRIFWTIFRKELPCFRILPVQEMPKRLSALQDLVGQWAVVIL